jgi:hypothetical protein
MDSDDISLKDRFEKQIAYLMQNPKLVLLSGFISEFKDIPNDIVSIRKVPQGLDKIKKRLKTRNAFNHVSVMFNKNAVNSVGGYQDINGFEDYDLWIRLVQAGYEVDNLQELLVYVRIGNNMIGRRQGLVYAKKEIAFFKKQKDRKFISNLEYLKLLLLRVPFRLLPPRMLTLFYRMLRHR